MRAEHRRFLTSSTGGDVFKVVARDGKALVLEGPMDWHPKHRKQRTMGAHQFKKTSCPVEQGVTPHHATKKKSAAQLQREIDEALANPAVKCPSPEHPLYPELRHIRQVAHDTSWGASQLAKDAEEAFRNGDCVKAAVMLEAAKRAIAKERRKRR
jgi:hypothetical protein